MTDDSVSGSAKYIGGQVEEALVDDDKWSHLV